jgi:hypothetical protein
MHLISSPFFSFDLQYDQQIEPKETAGITSIKPIIPNEGIFGNTVHLPFDYDKSTNENHSETK